eukprot:2415343-Amphidinium_carterae.1
MKRVAKNLPACSRPAVTWLYMKDTRSTWTVEPTPNWDWSQEVDSSTRCLSTPSNSFASLDVGTTGRCAAVSDAEMAFLGIGTSCLAFQQVGTYPDSWNRLNRSTYSCANIS